MFSHSSQVWSPRSKCQPGWLLTGLSFLSCGQLLITEPSCGPFLCSFKYTLTEASGFSWSSWSGKTRVRSGPYTSDLFNSLKRSFLKCSHIVLRCCFSWAQCYGTVILTLRRQRPEDREFETSVRHTASSRSNWATHPKTSKSTPPLPKPKRTWELQYMHPGGHSSICKNFRTWSCDWWLHGLMVILSFLNW